MSTSQHHDDPTADGAARAAQLAAMTLSIAEGVARLRAERLAGKAADDEHLAAAQRAQHRADEAARWLSERGQAPLGSPLGTDTLRAEPAPDGGWAVTIVCRPQDLADQSFPVPMPAAMATAPRAARDAVQPRPALTAPRPRPQLTTGPTPGAGGGGPR